MSNLNKKGSNYAQNLIEASLDPLITIGIDGKIMDVNHATVNITGIARKKLIGSDFSHYFTEKFKASEIYKEVLRNGTVINYSLTVLHKNGKHTDVLLNGSLLKDSLKNVLGVLIVARDITEQKSITKELRKAKTYAEQTTRNARKALINAEKTTLLAQESVQAKQLFLANMSHEIRTPLNAIIGFTKVLLKADIFNNTHKEYLQAIKISGDTLTVLINDILDLAKVEAGKMTFEKRVFKMEDSFNAMLHLFEIKIFNKDLELVKDYDRQIPGVLVGDPVRLHQIIINLLSNAVKFTNKGKITLTYKLLHEDGQRVTIEFSVCDTGIGIPENKLDSIFENFQQASADMTRLYGGTGLGLAIAKQLVESQGGSIFVKSKVGEGTIFNFILSFDKTNDIAELESEKLELDKDIKNIKVLVAEDVALNQLLIRTQLEEFNFQCDIAENGKVAIEKLLANSFDIILMDLMMPVMNGFEATEFIRKTMKLNVPIIALTADVTTVDFAKCKTSGMDDYISKPIDERMLYSKIVSLLKKP